MKKNVLYLIYVITVIGIIGSWLFGQYNALVIQQENVEGAWAQVETQYQRRADLVPNLVTVVKGYATHEKETLESVVAARANATNVTVNASTATPEQLEAFQAAQGQLGQALGRLLAVAESYPELKANENFLALQSQLEATENRITYARDLFNRTTQNYNASVRRFPNSIVAAIFGFEKKDYFQAEEGADKASEINF